MNINSLKKIIIITGHYGAGKTNLAVNLALWLADSGRRVRIVDLDIVNPYFRTADFSDLLSKKGVETVKSVYANTNLDIPAITFDVERLANEEGHLIIDVGGDDDGAIALGRYSEALSERSDVSVLYVINAYRYVSDGVNDCAAMLFGIEAASRFKITGIVNNSNLGEETTLQGVSDSASFAEAVSEKTGVPIFCTCVPHGCRSVTENEICAERLVKAPWEK